MYRLVAALVWGMLALGLFSWSWWLPDRPAPRLGGSDVSLGWFAVVLALFNLVRWTFSKPGDREGGTP
jgi:hypothetical protein